MADVKHRKSGMYWMTLALLTLTWTSVISADDWLSEAEVRDIEKFAGDVMGCANIPGLSLSVVRGDATFATGLGVANMATGQTVDRKTLFMLGSTSKAFVPYVLGEIMNGKENHDGRIKWNSTLKEILRQDAATEISPGWAGVSLKDLLVYRSGGSAADLSLMAGLPPGTDRGQVLRRLRFIHTIPEFKGSNHYSNLLYTVAGHLAERMTGTSWPELVRSRVLGRLAMNGSQFSPQGLSQEDVALPYRFRNARPGEQFLEQNLTLFNSSPFDPTAALMVSADDVVLWLRQLLRNLNNKGNDSGINMLIGDAFHQWVSAPENRTEGSLFHISETHLGYGMGWSSSYYRGLRRFQYSGGLYAYRSQIWIFPESMSAVYVAVNGPGTEASRRALDAISYYISDVLLGKETWVDTELACCCQGGSMDYDGDLDTQFAPFTTQFQLPRETYTGTFGNGIVGNLLVDLADAGTLMVGIGNNIMGQLTPDIVDSKLNIITAGPLLNTEEWGRHKVLEFFNLTEDIEAGVRDRRLFQKVRLFVTDKLYYDFERNKQFKTMLLLEEEVEKIMQASGNKGHNRKSGTKGNSEEEKQEDYENTQPITSTTSSPGTVFDETKPATNENRLSQDKYDSEDHPHLGMEGQGDDPNLDLNHNDSYDSEEATAKQEAVIDNSAVAEMDKNLSVSVTYASSLLTSLMVLFYVIVIL